MVRHFEVARWTSGPRRWGRVTSWGVVALVALPRMAHAEAPGAGLPPNDPPPVTVPPPPPPPPVLLFPMAPPAIPLPIAPMAIATPTSPAPLGGLLTAPSLVKASERDVDYTTRRFEPAGFPLLGGDSDIGLDRKSVV